LTGALFFLAYLSGTALSLPVSGVLSVVSGIVFGHLVGAVLALLACTAGGSIALLISRYLFRKIVQQRFTIQLAVINRGIEVSPRHVGLKQIKNAIDMTVLTEDKKLVLTEEMVRKDPSIKNLLNLTLQYYNNKRYEDCLAICGRILEIDPKNHLAYNNMCIAYIQLKKKKEAIRSCQKCLEIQPDFQLAKNNLRWAESLNRSMAPARRVNFGDPLSNSTSNQIFVSAPLPNRTRGSWASKTKRLDGSRAPNTTVEGAVFKVLSMMEDGNRTRTQPSSSSTLAPAAR